MKLFYQLIIKETKAGTAGHSDMWKIVIHPKWENNKGIFAHEYEHLKQWYVLLLVGLMLTSFVVLAAHHWFGPSVAAIAGAVGVYQSFWFRRWLYNYYEPYRKWAEVQAFKAQIPKLLSPVDDRWIVDALVNRYRLDTTEDEIRQMLYGT